jgi:hypothetical protein
MTNPTPHGQVPEALIDLIDAYAETRHRCGGIYNAKTEAARKAVIEALSGVQALSAAPAEVQSPWSRALEIRMAQGWKLKGDRVPVLYTDSINGEGVGRDDLWLCTTGALAASPTPPAEQQAMTVIDAEQWEPCSPSWIARGGDCAAAPRVWNAATCNHWHPKAAPTAAPQQEAQEPSHRETVDVVGVRSNGEHVNLGKIAMPPRMKAREIAIEQFGSFKDDDGSDAEMCFGALEYFLEWLIQQGWSKAPQPAPAPLSDDVVKDAARYRWLREHEGADGLIRSDCRGLYLPQRDALDSAVDALLFTTPSQRGEIAGDGKPCNNDHDPDCRWPDCRCRERERMAAAIDAARKQGGA